MPLTMNKKDRYFPTAVCTHCKHHRRTEGPAGNTWSHTCTLKENQPAIHPITGGKCYLSYDEKENIDFVDNKFAFCNTFNAQGKCPHFDSSN